MSDDDLIARLRKADEYEPLGHDGWEAADRIEQLVATNEALVKERDEAKRLMQARHREMLAADGLMRKHQRRAERLEAALVQCRGLYQVTHIHAAIDAALKRADHD